MFLGEGFRHSGPVQDLFANTHRLYFHEQNGDTNFADKHPDLLESLSRLTAVGFLRNEVKDRTGINTLVANNMLPGYFLEIPDRLRKIPSPAIESDVSEKVTPGYFVAGGTDIYVQKGEVLVESGVHLLNMNHELKNIYNGHVPFSAIFAFSFHRLQNISVPVFGKLSQRHATTAKLSTAKA